VLYTKKSEFNMDVLSILAIAQPFLLEKISGYIDPGSATAVMAMIIGAIAGAGMTLKLYWFKIKQKISRQ
jgi:hypothetical protein